MSQQVINVAKDFSRYPAGRFKTDGPYSGEGFRDQCLVPILKSSSGATINLDGTRGYGSSFLEEAFGGLVRDGYSADKINTAFKLYSSDKSLIKEIEDYINSATQSNGK
jgi:hypothetical protein